jgi:hypothetical protein
MESFLKGLFGGHRGHNHSQHHSNQKQQINTVLADVAPPSAEAVKGDMEAASSMMLLDSRERKRGRTSLVLDEDVVLSRDNSMCRMDRAWNPATPLLVSASVSEDDEEDDESRPIKRFRGERGRIVSILCAPLLMNEPEAESASPKNANVVQKSEKELRITDLPEELLFTCLSFVSGVEDRFSVQCTSKQFRKLSNRDEMLVNVRVGGDRETGLCGIIQDHDTPESASAALQPYATARNLEAIYMYVSVMSFVKCGLRLVSLVYLV